MAKAIKKKVSKKTDDSLEIKTPYPKEEKDKEYKDSAKLPSLKKVKTDEIDYLGNKLADLSERVNELELSLSDINNRLKVVTGRMGL